MGLHWVHKMKINLSKQANACEIEKVKFKNRAHNGEGYCVAFPALTTGEVLTLFSVLENAGVKNAIAHDLFAYLSNAMTRENMI